MTASHRQTNYRATCDECDGDSTLPYVSASEKRAEMAAKAHTMETEHDVTVERVTVVADGGVRLFDPPNGMTLHHVVCRDCPMEQICDYSDTAKALEHTHAERTGHDVARAEVQR